MSKTFSKITESNNTLLVVDSLNLAFRYKHSGATDFAEDYLRTVQSLKKSYKASHVIIAGDQGSSSYRKAIYPEYKQNRKDKFENQTDAEKAAFELFFEDFQKTLEHIAENTEFPILRFQGVEADDIAAYIVSKKSKLPVDDIWLVSSDKDWDLLVQPNVSRFSYVTRKEVTVDNWNDHYDFNPEDYISIKCLTGDPKVLEQRPQYVIYSKSIQVYHGKECQDRVLLTLNISLRAIYTFLGEPTFGV